jgi:hypothetical protein
MPIILAMSMMMYRHSVCHLTILVLSALSLLRHTDARRRLARGNYTRYDVQSICIIYCVLCRSVVHSFCMQHRVIWWASSAAIDNTVHGACCLDRTIEAYLPRHEHHHVPSFYLPPPTSSASPPLTNHHNHHHDHHHRTIPLLTPPFCFGS